MNNDKKTRQTQQVKATILLAILVTSVLAFSPYLTQKAVYAATVSWDGGAGTVFWSDAANWSGDNLPTSSDNIVIDGDTDVLLDFDFTLDNDGTITINHIILEMDGSVTNTGTINIGGGIPVGGINNTGTINNKAGGIINNDGRIGNRGTIINECGATFTNSGTYSGNPVVNEPCPPDTTNPTVSISSPQDGNYLNTRQFQVKGTSSDNAGGSGVQSVVVEIDGGSPHTATPKASGDWSTWSITTTSLSDGQHTIKATATDNAGNEGTNSIKVNVDTNSPDTKITSAKDGKGTTIPKSGNTHSSKITFTFTGTDNTGGSGVAGFECSLDSSSDFTTCTSAKSYSELKSGAHTFYVRSLDNAGNADPSPATYKWRINGPVV